MDPVDVVPASRRVIIVGAGPVGLLLANLLGMRGIPTTVLEKGKAGIVRSRAIGVAPPSLEILEEVALADRFLAIGLPIRRAVVHGTGRKLGELCFNGVHSRYPFIISIPQERTMKILTEGLARFPQVDLRYSREVTDVSESPDSVVARCADGSMWTGTCCVGADGFHGRVTHSAGISKRGGRYRHAFYMADYADGSDLVDIAHLWFTREGAVESFPLPDGVRRWIVQLPKQPAVATEDVGVDVEGIVASRTGYRLSRTDRGWESAFQPSWSEVETFTRGRIFLAGDAAHTMSPIGGQGMNTGFADAALLAATLDNLLSETRPSAWSAGTSAHNRYTRLRRRAARVATRRARAGMAVGTVRGAFGSSVRGILVALLLRGPFRKAVARHFAMLTIPTGCADQPLFSHG